MSDDFGWAQLCRPPEPVVLNLAKCCSAMDSEAQAPLDDLIEHVGALLPIGAADSLQKNSALGRLLLLGVVSATETFFRQMLARAVRVCHRCRRHAGSRQIQFAAVDQYGADHVELGLVEHVVFSTKGELLRTVLKVTGLDDLAKDESFKAALEVFDQVCQLRHACVHARGELGTLNVVELGLDSAGRRAVHLDLGELHQAAKACLAVARGFDVVLYRRILERWMNEGDLVGAWNIDRNRFAPLFKLCKSATDGVGAADAHAAYNQILPTLQQRLARRTSSGG